MKQTKYLLASVALGTLTACGSSGTNIIYAGDAVITPADYVGKTFPLRFVGVNGDTNALKRGNGTARFISETEIAIKFDGIDETVVEFPVSSGDYFGSTINLSTEIISPALTGATGETADSLYAGFLGFQTNPSDMPSIDTFSYFDGDGAVMILSNGLDSIAESGSVSLLVNFGTGSVTGDLFQADGSDFYAVLTDGQISGNGFTGGVQIEQDLAFPTTTNDDAEGTFFGNDAGNLAGTFGGTYDGGLDGPIDFVGAFAGDKSLPF